jgi:hypothetical protein
MAPRQDEDSDSDEEEMARFEEKLDGYEAMGLDVTALRVLLETDPVKFKETHLELIGRQLRGEEEVEPSQDDLEEEEQVEISPEEKEEIDEEEADEDMELLMEGAGPEEALAAPPEIPDKDLLPDEGDTDEEELDLLEDTEEGEEEPAPEQEVEEEVEADIDVETEVTSDELEAPAEEERIEEEAEEESPGEEPQAEDETPEEEVEETPKEEEEEAPEEEEEEVPERDEGEVPERDEGEKVTPLEEEEEEIAVPEAEEAPPEETVEEPVEGPPEVEEAEEEVLAPEEETVVLLEGIPGKEETTPAEELTEEVEEEEPEPEARPVAKTDKVVRPRRVAAKKAPPKAVAAKRPPPKRVKPKVVTAKPPKRRGPRLGRGAIAAIVVMIVIVSSVGGYSVFWSNENPIALFTFEPETPEVGELVRFDAGGSYDPDEDGRLEYLWRFGDGSKAKGKVVNHAFLTSESFTVRLTIKDTRNGESMTGRVISIDPLTLSMGPPLLGDEYNYRVFGNASISNRAESLITFTTPALTYKIYEVEADIEGIKSFQVLDRRQAKDGFMRYHDVRVEKTVYDLDNIDGIIKTDRALDPRFTGWMLAEVQESVCLQWERGVVSKNSVSTSMNAANYADISSTDDGTFYAQLDGIQETFSMNEFLRSTTFTSDDTAAHDLVLGSSVYHWKVKGMEDVAGLQDPALHINVTMSPATLTANKLVSFFSDVWLSKGLSQPAKSHVFVKGRQDGNQFRLDLTETLTGHTDGDEEATGVCSADHAYTVKGEYHDDFRTLDLVPDRGGTGGGFDFSPQEAIDEAKAEDGDFNSYLSTHPDAFCHIGNYTDDGGDSTWVLAFGQKGSGETYEIVIQRTGALGLNFVDGTSSSDKPQPVSGRTDIREVVTLSRGIQLMRNETDIRNRCFKDASPNWELYTFNVSEGASTISLDPTTVLSGSEHAGYVFLLVSRTGEHQAALDASNGQVLFSWTHSETFDGAL